MQLLFSSTTWGYAVKSMLITNSYWLLCYATEVTVCYDHTYLTYWNITPLKLKPSDDGVEMVEIFSDTADDTTDDTSDNESLDTIAAIVQDVLPRKINDEEGALVF